MQPSPLFAGIADWLLDRALRERDLMQTVRGLGHRLVEGGVPVCRINIGGLIWHPVLGALDITWYVETDRCTNNVHPRAAANTPEFRNSPFYSLIANGQAFVRYRLDDGTERQRYPLLGKLADDGVVDYVAMFESYGRPAPLEWAGLPAGAEGVLISFATNRIGGFAEAEVASLRQLSRVLALAVKAATDQSLATTLLETYLGRISGRSVLDGLMQRGDARLIDCVLWFSDLRGSTAMARKLDIATYFGAINDYFDCAAGAVLDHGGEVLKFVGDGVMAIFPIDEQSRPAVDMCTAAVMSAREALSRAERRNQTRVAQGLGPIAFGVALHAGAVMYGNVGTRQRLDMTVTGPAANTVVRLEGLCKRLAVPVVASREFDDLYRGPLVPLGQQQAAGIEGGLEAYTLPELGVATLRPVGAGSADGR